MLSSASYTLPVVRGDFVMTGNVLECVRDDDDGSERPRSNLDDRKVSFGFCVFVWFVWTPSLWRVCCWKFELGFPPEDWTGLMGFLDV